MKSIDSDILKEKFNLTRNEAVVFLEILRYGNSKIGKIIKTTGLHRGSVYNNFQRLIDKGLLYHIKKDNIDYYGANPYGFLSMINEEEINLESKKELIRKINEMSKFSINNEIPSSIYCIEGEKGFKGLFLEILNSSKEEDYLFMGNGGEMRDRLGEIYYRNSQKMKILTKSNCKVILNINKKEHPFSGEVRGKIRWTKNNDFSSVNTWITGNKTIIVDWDSEPLRSLVIDNRNIAKQNKIVYEIIIMASIIEREVGRNFKTGTKLSDQDLEKLSEERRIVGGIFYNRLAANMGLESDATLQYVTRSNSSRATSRSSQGM